MIDPLLERSMRLRASVRHAEPRMNGPNSSSTSSLACMVYRDNQMPRMRFQDGHSQAMLDFQRLLRPIHTTFHLSISSCGSQEKVKLTASLVRLCKLKFSRSW